MTRDEYLIRQYEFQPRGMSLPHSKLMDIDIVEIRSMARQRDSLRKHIRENLSNEAIARRFGVHVRTVEKVLAFDSWSHV